MNRTHYDNNSSPLVSVLIPMYNAEPYIEATINSITSQTYKNLEILVSNDCSTDKSEDIVRRLMEKDSRIKLYNNSKNVYIAENRNILIALAKGKYVAWQDADDISLPERLEKQVELLERLPHVGIVGGSLEIFNDTEGTNSIRRYAEKDKDLRKKIFRYSPVAQPTAMIRIEALNRVGAYDLSAPPAEDLDMSFRIGEYYEFANLPDITIKYREHPNSATFTRLKIIEKNTLKIRLKYAKTKYYNMNLADYIYNFLQYISIYIVPPKLKIKLFNKLRNSRVPKNI